MEKTKTIITILFFVLLLNLSIVNALTQEEISQAKDLINSNASASCDVLTDSQLELLGEYYMSQMQEMMGRNRMYANMARMMYCNQGNMMQTGGMMQGNNMMANMMNMMMGGQSPVQANNMMGQGMMNNSWGFNNILYTLLLIGLAILVYSWIFNQLKNVKKVRK